MGKGVSRGDELRLRIGKETNDQKASACGRHGGGGRRPTRRCSNGIFDGQGQVPTKGLLNTARFALGAVLVYQLALLYQHKHDQDWRAGLKAFLKAA